MRTERVSKQIVGVLAVALGLVLLIAWTPAYVGFALAITAAVGWCIWIECHPST